MHRILKKDVHVCDDKGKEVGIITMIKLNEAFLGHFTGVEIDKLTIFFSYG